MFRPRLIRPLWLAAIAALASPAAPAEPLPVARVERGAATLFETDILPLLQRSCLACHSESERRGDLVLESVAAMLEGGDSGPAIVPGSAEKSLLFALAAHRDDPVMPPQGNGVNAANLTPEELGLLALWIDQGAKVAGPSRTPVVPRRWRAIAPSFVPVSSVAVTSDAQVVAVARANRLLLHHAPSGRIVAELVDPALGPTSAAHRDLVGALAFNREGDLLASGGFREVKVWRRPSDVRAFEVAGGAATAIAASPDGRLFATAAAGSVRLWDGVSGAPGPVITGPAEGATALLFDPDGTALTIAAADGTLRRVRTDDGAVLGAALAAQPVRAMALVPTGGSLPSLPLAERVLVVGGTDATLRLTSLPEAVPERIVPEPAPRRRLAASRDRRLLAVASETTVRLLHAGDDGVWVGGANWILDRGPVTSLSLLEASGPAGTVVATGAADGSVTLWGASDGRMVRRFASSAAPVTALAAAGDGGLLASADDRGGVTVWRGVDGVAERVPVLPPALDTVTATAFHPGRGLLAIAGTAGGNAMIVVRAIDGSVGPVVLSGHGAPIRVLDFLADGSRLLSGGDDRSARIWDWSKPGAPQVGAIPDTGAAVVAIAATADAARLLAAGADQVVRSFSVADAVLVHEHRGHTGPLLAVGYTAAGQPWSASADSSVRFWNPADGQQASSWALPTPPLAIAASADGQTLVAAGSDGVVRSHQLAGGQLAKAFSGPAGQARSFMLSADGVRGVSFETTAGRTVVRGWDVTGGRLLEAIDEDACAAALPESVGTLLRVGPRGEVERVRFGAIRHLDGIQQPVTGMAIVGGTLLVAAADGAIRGFQIATGQATFTVGHGGAVTTLAASADGSVVASGGRGGIVRFWKPDGSAIGPGITGLQGDVSALALSSDGRRAVVGMAAGAPSGGAIGVHETATGLLLERFAGHLAGVAEAFVATDGGSVITGADDAVWLWPLGTLAVVPGQGGAITAIAAMPTVPLEVVTGAADGTVRRVRLADGRVVGQFQHGGAVSAVAVRTDGARIASAGESGSLRLWGPDGQPVAEVRGDLRRSTTVARLTRQQVAAAERLAIVRQRAEGAEKDVPTKAEASSRAKATLDAAETDLRSKQDALAAADAARIGAEKSALNASAEARSAALARQRADRQVLDVQMEVTVAQQRSALLAAAAAAAPADAAKKQAADAAVQSVAAAQQKLQQMQSAAQAAAAAAMAAATTANGMTQKVTETQKPAADSATAVRTALVTRRVAAQEHEISARELAQSTAALPIAREGLARAEASLAEVKQALETATAAAAAAVAPIRQVSFSPDGTLVATAGDFPAAALWDAETGSAVATFQGHATRLVGAAFLGDGRLVTAGGDATAIAWQMNPRWKLELTIGAADRSDLIVDRVLAVDWSADSANLLVGGGVPSRSGELSLFRVADGSRVLHLPDAHDDAVLTARISPDGRRIASGGADRYLRTFDASDGRRLRRFEGHTNYVLGVAWKSDGQTLASAGADNTVKLWDAESGDQRATVPPLTRHVTALRFVGDTDNFVSSCGDRVVRLHNASNGGVVRTFPAMAAWIHCVDVTPGGEVLVAGDADGTARSWNANTGQPVSDLEIPTP